ncbi:AAA family ATPase [Acidianus sulfidivorans JP7]|uniref:ATPase n=1 Tax=Acidianus sulfidivorans JP7 TaxID=619593 RepID=A0A2U9IL73_9CREN|nr:ATP-binding protein [Acidianus sulfidivorans]AWR96761.1 AAA family ATPase [Acidianus sulfidivorans JP7]
MIFINMIFVNREKELESLKERLSSPNFELIIIYGRRRIGKTSLILKAIQDMQDSIYYLATEKNNLPKFKEVCKKKFPEVEYIKEDWEALFHFLKDKIVIIDEFPYMVEEDKTIVSTFQRIVDNILKTTKTKLILLGSSISVMEDAISYKSPLYGRSTASMKIRELRFKALKSYGFDIEEAVKIYGFAGGVPLYLNKVKQPFYKWINEEIKRVDSFIKDEIDFLLRYEFRDISTYKEILYAISLGKNSLGEIKDFVRINGDISSYLNKLERIELISRELPITESKRKGGKYVIIDNFTNFWFRFIYPNLSFIEEGKYEIDEESYNQYLGFIFEKIAREFVKDNYPISKIGRQWWKDVEVDILALGKIKIAGECKWSNDVDPDRVLFELEEKMKKMNINVDKYIIFAKSFSKKLERSDVELVDLEALKKWLYSS